MRKLLISVDSTAPLAMVLSCAALFAGACGPGTGPTLGDGDAPFADMSVVAGKDAGALDAASPGSGDLSHAMAADLSQSPPDLTPYNPRNPQGMGPAPVDIGSTKDLAAAGSYVLLAKTGITNVTGSAITGGHLGLSPAAATFITGFSLIDDPSNVYSTSASVVPPAKVYASNYAKPTPAHLTAAVLSMEGAYTDAAGRTNADFLNFAKGNLGGKTLAPGLYTWGGTVTIPDDVTISGKANDVWIFQVANDLDVSTAKKVILAGGASASNVFWQVAGQVTIHANAHFEGVILCQTGITLQTNATMLGRALSQSLVALDDNAVTAP